MDNEVTQTLTLTHDECEDIRYALALLSDEAGAKASYAGRSSEMGQRLLAASERYRALARKVTDY